MKYVKQLAIIITISLLGEILSKLLPFTIPASVYGLFLMLAALVTRVIKVEQIKETSDLLLDIMPIMFVPASVGLMESWGLLKDILVPVLIVSILGTVIVMIVSGKTVDGIMRLTNRRAVMTDGITVDGKDIEGNGEESLARGEVESRECVKISTVRNAVTSSKQEMVRNAVEGSKQEDK